MSTKSTSALLGGWGYAGSKPERVTLVSEREGLEAKKMSKLGNIAGSQLHHRASDGRATYALPPLCRGTRSNIDFYPFLLFDKVYVDEGNFLKILNGQSFNPNTCRNYLWEHLPSNYFRIDPHVKILEKLAEDGIIQLKNFSQLIEKEYIEILEGMIQNDLANSTLWEACTNSMEIWKGYLESVIPERTDKQEALEISIYRIERCIHLLKSVGASKILRPSINTKADSWTDDDARAYNYESIDDVNSTILLSRILDCPIYDWEDHMPYYRIKYSGVAMPGPGEDSHTLKKFFTAFIPDFEIISYSQIQDIRSDTRFQKLKQLVFNKELEPPSNEAVLDALSDVAKMKQKINNFNRIIGWLTFPVGLIPGIGSLISKGLETIASKAAERIIGHQYSWQCFFVDFRERYSRERIHNELLIKNGGIITNEYILNELDEDLAIVKDELHELDTKRSILLARKKRVEELITRAKERAVNSEGQQQLPSIFTEEARHKAQARVLVGNRNTRTFHMMNCKFVDEISEANKELFEKRLTAIKDGFAPCRICQPL